MLASAGLSPASRTSSTLANLQVLGPSQVKDEIQIAKHELKTKGIAVGKGAAFFGVAAVFGLFLIIALVAAAILGLGTVMPYWASALILPSSS